MSQIVPGRAPECIIRRIQLDFAIALANRDKFYEFRYILKCIDSMIQDDIFKRMSFIFVIFHN